MVPLKIQLRMRMSDYCSKAYSLASKDPAIVSFGGVTAAEC